MSCSTAKVMIRLVDMETETLVLMSHPKDSRSRDERKPVFGVSNSLSVSEAGSKLEISDLRRRENVLSVK